MAAIATLTVLAAMVALVAAPVVVTHIAAERFAWSDRVADWVFTAATIATIAAVMLLA